MSEAAQRLAWKNYDSNEAVMVEIQFASDRLRVARPTVEAWRALESVLEFHDYNVKPRDSHGYFPRNVDGTDVRSLHAFGIAIDINASTNPMRKTPNKRRVRFSSKPTQAERGEDVKRNLADTDMTEAMIEDVRRIRTLGGKPLFGWGGDWVSLKDAMHFHIDVSPGELGLGVDWATVPGRHDAYDEGLDEPLRADPDDADYHDHVHAEHPFDHVSGEEEAMADISSVQRFRPLLDYIAKCEGTANQPGGGYNTSLGYGIFTGGEQPLTRMTLDQIDDLQRQMLRHPRNHFNSSALGRYQIVGKTLRGLRRKLGLSGSELYSPALQDRLGAVLIEGRGRDVRGLRQEWASLQNKSASEILAKYDEIGPASQIIIEPDWPVPSDAGSVSVLLELFRRLSDRIDIAPRQESSAVLKQGDSGPQVKALQQALRERDYQVGRIDGVYGTLTAAAVASFQIDHALQVTTTGEVDDVTWAALSKAPGRPLSDARKNATADDLRRSGSVTIANADRARLIGLISSILGTLGLGKSAYDNLSPTRAAAQTISNGTAPDQMTAEAFAQILKTVPKNVLQEFFQLNVPQMNSALAKAHDLAITGAHKVGAVASTTSPPSIWPLLETTLPVVMNSLVPGLGGSLAVLGLGIATQVFGTKIIERRVQNQRDGSNIGAGST